MKGIWGGDGGEGEVRGGCYEGVTRIHNICKY